MKGSEPEVPREFCYDVLPQQDVVQRIDRVHLQGEVLILGIAWINHHSVYARSKCGREFQPFYWHRNQRVQRHLPQASQQCLRITCGLNKQPM